MQKPVSTSIITVCYNSEKTIRDTIESVLNQSYPNIEYLIIDGKSVDNTVSIAEAYRAQFEAKGYGFRIVSEKDSGIYDAMNKGINMSRGELIGIINSDDWYEGNAVEIAVNTYLQERYDMFYADLRLIRGDRRPIIKSSRHGKLVTSRHWNHPTTFIPRHTYDELGTFRCEDIYDDFDLYLRIRRANKRILIRNEVLANFRVGGVSNIKTIDTCRKRCMTRYKCYRNNGYSPLYLIECIAMEAAKLILS